MNGTRRLHDAGQSIWLDHITRGLLGSGGLRRYIDELSVTGLTSNPTIFDHAIRSGPDYDAGIREKLAVGLAGERLFFELALEDLTQAADLFRPIHEATNRIDGWVSLELSPTLAYDTKGSVAATPRSSRPALVSAKRCPTGTGHATASADRRAANTPTSARDRPEGRGTTPCQTGE